MTEKFWKEFWQKLGYWEQKSCLLHSFFWIWYSPCPSCLLSVPDKSLDCKSTTVCGGWRWWYFFIYCEDCRTRSVAGMKGVPHLEAAKITIINNEFSFMWGIWRKVQFLRVCAIKHYYFLLCRLWLLISRMRVPLLWLQQLPGTCRKLSRLKTTVLSTGKGMGQQGVTVIKVAGCFGVLSAAQVNHVFFLWHYCWWARVAFEDF